MLLDNFSYIRNQLIQVRQSVVNVHPFLIETRVAIVCIREALLDAVKRVGFCDCSLFELGVFNGDRYEVVSEHAKIGQFLET